MTKQSYLEVPYEGIEHLVDDKLILLVTATDLETTYTHDHIKPIAGYEHIIQVFEGSQTFYIGMFGLYKIVHVQCAMGSLSRSGSTNTILTTCQRLKCKVIIMVGIAFGIDETDQQIGDVFVAESIIPYNLKRVGEAKNIPRGIEIPSSLLLLNRFKNIRNWEYQLPDGKISKLIPTRILSGEELIDNIEHRNNLVSLYPDSKGGEMEGAGLYSACSSIKTDFILVKGLCDFADGKKGINKKKNQEVAISAALSLSLKLFNSTSAFSELKIFPFENLPKSVSQNSEINEVLFDFYDISKESFYIPRDSDSMFNGVLNQYGIWVCGPSGCGKSNLIIRNLIASNKEFIQVDLGSCIGQEVESFFKEILYELSFKVGGIKTQYQPSTFSECSKELITLLDKFYANKELIIFIEEIPISSEKDQKEFADKIFSILISKNLKNGLSNIKFVLSSIHNPTKDIALIHNKIHQQIYFIPLSFWVEEDITQLLEMILKEFRLILKPEFKKLLINTAKGSPRFIKKFFRSIHILNKIDEKTLNTILKETERELS